MLVRTVTASRASRDSARFDRGGQHFRSARGMNGEHIHAQPRRRAHGRGDRVGNIMQLQIKKYREAAPLQLGDQGVSLSNIKLQADFEPARGAL